MPPPPHSPCIAPPPPRESSFDGLGSLVRRPPPAPCCIPRPLISQEGPGSDFQYSLLPTDAVLPPGFFASVALEWNASRLSVAPTAPTVLPTTASPGASYGGRCTAVDDDVLLGTQTYPIQSRLYLYPTGDGDPRGTYFLGAGPKVSAAQICTHPHEHAYSHARMRRLCAGCSHTRIRIRVCEYAAHTHMW